jgi:hypothetical protein
MDNQQETKDNNRLGSSETIRGAVFITRRDSPAFSEN